MPTNTDLVTDLPADFEVFGQAVATSMADLLGGTTGQILSKASGTNMDFTWIANDQGDITNIGVTSPITGGGSSGSVTIGIDDATTSVKGAVQLSSSTSSTSTILAATPSAVKSAYDLADAAIAKTTLTTAGDVIYRNATVPARLGIGTAGQVLTVNSGATAPEWSTSASGGMTLLSTTTSWSTTTTISIPSGYTDFKLICSNVVSASPDDSLYARFNSNSNSVYAQDGFVSSTAGTIGNSGSFAYGTEWYPFGISGTSAKPCSFIIYGHKYLDTIAKVFESQVMQANASVRRNVSVLGSFDSTSAISSISFTGGTAFTSATAYLYGIK